jgi:tetratricopeptide (TPR) repeat protein
VGKASRHKRAQPGVAAARPALSEAEGAAGARERPPLHPALICAALVVLVLLVFGRTAFNGYIQFDDPDYVSANAVVQRGLSAEGLRYAFTTLKPYYWQPLTWISHQVDASLFGTRPGPQHLVSVLLHGLTAALFFLFLQRATGRTAAAAAAAAIWAVHPLRVESVAWIAERKDVLAGLFFVATLLAYERFVRRRSAVRYAVVLLMFALALMSKPAVVAAPLVLILLNWWPFDRLRTEWRKAVLEAVPPAILTIPIMAVTLMGQRGAIADIPLSLRLSNAIRSAGAYLVKLLLPIDLSIVYPFRKDIGLEAAIAAFVLAAITLAAWRFRKSHPWLATGWGWYLAMLLPVVGLVQSGAQAMADRFMYTPSMGIAVAAVWLIAGRVSRKAAIAATAGAVLALSALSIHYAGLWRDTITLFAHATAATRNNAVAHLVLGNALLAENRLDEANNEYSKAMSAGGGSLPAASAGEALLKQGRFVEAVEPLQRAVDADPSLGSAHENLALALINTGRAATALPHLETALRLDPSRKLDILPARGAAKLALGRIDEALADFQQVVNARPSAASWNALASGYSSKDDFANAERAYREATRLDPSAYEARMNFAAMLSRAGRNAEALAQVSEAARLAPNSVEPRVYQALIEAQMGRPRDAAGHAEEAQRIDAQKANEYFTNAVHMPPKDSNLADFIATMRAR